jgi:hypothetical protein
LEQALERGRVVLLLDGLDEVNTEKRPAVVKRIKDFLDTCEKCRVVITCRTQVYQGEFDGVVKQTLEVMEFTDAQIQQFLRPWQVEMPAEKSIQQLVQSLNNRPRIKELARNPLLLTIIAYLYCDTSFVLPHSRAEFYAKSTEILLETWDQSKQTPNTYKGFTKRLVLQHLALYAQDNAGERQQDRKTLSFQEVMAEIKTVLPGLDLDPEKDASTILAEIVERSGLLLRIDGGAKYQFSHLTLQEFFAAEALRDQSDKMIQRVETDLDAWREVVKLWCGLANDSTAVIQAIYPTNKVVTTTEVSRASLSLECLASAQKVDNNFAEKIIDEMTSRLSRRLSFNPQGQNNTRNESIQEAFGAVAADPRPRGQKVFDNLVKVFNQTENPEIRTYEAQQKILSAIAISHSNRPDAARNMLSGYPRFSEVRDMIVRLGDLAVPCLKTCTESQDLPIVKSALNDLAKIGTPEAAKALVPLLWHPELPISGQTAWHLARLMPQPEIEATLTNDCALPDNHSTEYHDWVWAPFALASNRNQPINVITGRIAYLLDKTPTEVIPRPISLVDPRLMIPVCAIATVLQVTLPTRWPANADSFLTGEPNDSAILEKVDTILGNVESATKWRRSFLAVLPAKLQLELLKRLITFSKTPQPQDWPNIFQRVKFNFAQSWEYNFIILACLLASAGAITEILYLPFQAKGDWTSWIFSLPVMVLIYTWIFIWQGIEQESREAKRMNPILFLKLGVLGWLNFWLDFWLLLRDKIFRVSITPFHKEMTNTGTFAAITALVFVFGSFDSFAFGGDVAGDAAIAVAFAIGFTCDMAITVVFTYAGAYAGAFAGIGFTLTGIVIAIALIRVIIAITLPGIGLTGTVLSAIAGAITGAGIGFRSTAAGKLNSKSYFWAILAYPFYCAAPLVVIYSAVGLHNWYTWPVVTSIWTALIIVCTALWQWGQTKERKARNPLQGILDGYVPNPNLHSSRRKGSSTSPKS